MWRWIGIDVLPVIDVSVSLRSLRAEVDRVASEKKVVSRRDSESVAHECGRVAAQSEGHWSRDTIARVLSVSLLFILTKVAGHI